MTQAHSSIETPPTPGPNPSRGENPENALYAIWKVAEPWERPQVEERLLQYLRRHASKVCWMVLHTHQPHLVDEIAVDALMALGSFEERSAFSTWFHSRALYRCRSEFRTQMYRKEISLDAPHVRQMFARQGSRDLEADYTVREMLAKLTDREQEFVDLKVQAGYSDADIGTELGMSRQAVQWTWTKLRKKLRGLYSGVETAE
jgi:RNA polymerase sigma factor (sigma-70 family)